MVYPPVLSERAPGTPGGHDPEHRQFDEYDQPFHGNEITHCWPTRARGLILSLEEISQCFKLILHVLKMAISGFPNKVLTSKHLF